MIRLENIAAGYSRPILEKISARFEEGKITCILGKNGSGKSTLLKTAGALLPALEGTAYYNQNSLHQMKPEERARKLAMVWPMENLPMCTVFQLVLHGRFPYLSIPRRYSKRDFEMVEYALKQLGIEEVKDSLLSDISSGQRQKAQLACALVQQTEALFLDEPLVFLDMDGQVEMMERLKEMKKKPMTIAVILHDLGLALEYGDAYLVLDQGTGVFFKNRDELLNSRILEKVFGFRAKMVQADGYEKAVFIPAGLPAQAGKQLK